MSKSPKSVAGKVLATGSASPEELKTLAGAVLGDDSLTPPKEKDRAELQRLLQAIEGKEGQTERAAEIRRMLDAMGDG